RGGCGDGLDVHPLHERDAVSDQARFRRDARGRRTARRGRDFFAPPDQCRAGYLVRSGHFLPALRAVPVAGESPSGHRAAYGDEHSRMSLTALDMLTDAMRLCNLLDENEVPSAEQGVKGLRTMNQMVAQWVEDGIRLPWHIVADL